MTAITQTQSHMLSQTKRRALMREFPWVGLYLPSAARSVRVERLDAEFALGKRDICVEVSWGDGNDYYHEYTCIIDQDGTPLATVGAVEYCKPVRWWRPHPKLLTRLEPKDTVEAALKRMRPEVLQQVAFVLSVIPERVERGHIVYDMVIYKTPVGKTPLEVIEESIEAERNKLKVA